MPKFKNFEDFTKMFRDDLIDESIKRGLPATGARTLLIASLYEYDGDLIKKQYHEHKVKGFGNDHDGTKLRARLGHVKKNLIAAARQRFAAEEAYLNKRMARAKAKLEERLQEAAEFTAIQSGLINKKLDALRKVGGSNRITKPASKVSFREQLT